MNSLSVEERIQILTCLVEGSGVRSTARITGHAKGTVLRVIREVGPACAEALDRYITDLTCEHVEMDEIWTFVYCKDAKLPKPMRGHSDVGSIWTWSATCRDCKIILDWTMGERSMKTAAPFISRLAKRFAGRTQITADGHPTYRTALLAAFNLGQLDFAEEKKIYQGTSSGSRVNSPEQRYSPGQIVEWTKKPIIGNPDMATATTSHMERVHLSYRMQNRRFTRLTNGFSRKLEYHRNMFAIYVFFYNFIRKHSALGRGKTPAMQAGVVEHAFTMRDMLFAADQFRAVA